MEKRLPLKAQLLLIQLLLILMPFKLTAQAQELSPLIRIQLWVPAEEDPSRMNSAREGESPYMPAIRNLKSIAPFMLEGMIYGWNVTYTPSDSVRRIDEYYECTPVSEILADDPSIEWTESEITDETISCWLDYHRSDAQVQYRKWWNSVNIARITGKGSASLSLGPEGIKQAVIDAAKSAIRAYLQKTEKNKPKEMTGSLLLADVTPRVYIDHGQYVADLDFFLYVDKIEKYSYY